MPIKPENRARYPKDWKQIRAVILERAGHRCEGSPDFPDCRAVNYEAHPETGSKVVLTIAHLGIPAHFPVELHVTRSAEASQVFNIVGLFVPFDAESPEWNFMMYRRALAEFLRGSATVGAPFFIPLPSRLSGLVPGGAIMHEPFSMTPEQIVLTDWSLFGKPVESAFVPAKPSTTAQIPAANSKFFSASLACSLSEATLASAYGFVATGIRARLNIVGRLLCSNRKENSANHAIDMCGAFSWSGHAKLYHADEYPENCDHSNLMAWCQRCHLNYDKHHHAQNSAATRRSRSPQVDMLDSIGSTT